MRYLVIALTALVAVAFMTPQKAEAQVDMLMPGDKAAVGCGSNYYNIEIGSEESESGVGCEAVFMYNRVKLGAEVGSKDFGFDSLYGGVSLGVGMGEHWVFTVSVDGSGGYGKHPTDTGAFLVDRQFNIKTRLGVRF